MLVTPSKKKKSVFPETTSRDQSSNSAHSSTTSASSSSQSLTSAPGTLGSSTYTMSSISSSTSTTTTSSSSSIGQLLQSIQSPSPALLQDPALLHQLLPALQAALQANNTTIDMTKLNEGEQICLFTLPHILTMCIYV